MPPDPGEVQTVTGLQLHLVDLGLLEVRVSFIVGGVKVDRAIVVRHHNILGLTLLPGAGSTSIYEFGMPRRHYREILVPLKYAHHVLISISVRQRQGPHAMPEGSGCGLEVGLHQMRWADIFL